MRRLIAKRVRSTKQAFLEREKRSKAHANGTFFNDRNKKKRIVRSLPAYKRKEEKKFHKK
jgi:hypothetical protein